uniref:L-gulonate 5-dehydrogenase n=1 Tax=Candidatus Kentrum sp. MB TaxID=2138164 RepID=A0A451B984_9GAMM|nr:MAG: L-gulonate 5-dehydrogenase [Candidatus Kentron sp. MB]VFK74848.1 MAG: L-gulonate 5-dehydrogenase [Candidatus Kentron sp. MB]
MANVDNFQLLIRRPGVVEITSAPILCALRSKDVRVQVARVTLCGSDYALFNGRYGGPSTYPIRFGHEWAGIVEEVGEEVDDLSPGDQVTGDCSKWCGTCPNCADDKNLCQHIGKFGITEDGYAQRSLVVPRRYLYPDHHNLPLDLLALAEPFAVAMHAIGRVGTQGGEARDRTVVIGAGALGVALSLLLQRCLGWRNVTLWEASPAKRQLIQHHFPCAGLDVVAPGESIDGYTYNALYGGDSPRVVFEASGSRSGLELALRIAGPRATVVSLGFLTEPVAEMRHISVKSLTVLGSIGGTGEFSQVLEFLSNHRDLVKPMITACYPYHNVENAFGEGSNKDRHIKVQIDLSEEVDSHG